jgi:hypothetical protein
MRRWIVPLVLLLFLAAALGWASVDAQSDELEVGHVEVVAGDGYNSIARRLSPLGVSDAQVAAFGQAIRAANGNLAVIHPGQILHYDAADVPTPPPSTTVAATTTTEAPPSTTTTTTPPLGDDFTASFVRPEDFYDRFVTGVHFRADDYDKSATFHGDHNDACEGPTTGRTVHLDGDDNDEVFWWCAPTGPDSGHVMTGMGAAGFGYSIVSFMPARTFTDYSRVCIDANNTDLGGDKWWMMAAVPTAAFLANGDRLDYVSPLAEDIDDTAVVMPAGSFSFMVNDNKIRAYQGRTERIFDWFQWSTNDRATRYTHCMVDNGDGTVTMTREVGVSNQDAPGGIRTVTVPGSLPDDAVILFLDDTYDPPKHGSGADQTTRHWDNVSIT